MAHYAYLDVNNIVTMVIVGKDEDEGGVDWEEYYGAVRTSYNTHGGTHRLGGTPFRMNYAGVGYTFDPTIGPDGAFIPPRPFASWTLNPTTCLWEAPVPKPGDEYVWDEAAGAWVKIDA